MQRIKFYYDTLLKNDNESIIIFVDSFDVIATRSQEFLLETFDCFHKPIVIGAEWYCGSSKNCAKIDNVWKSYRLAPYRQYANAGCVMGKVKYLKEMYGWILNSHFEDDQLALSNWIQLNYENVAIDSGSSIFYNCHIFDGNFDTSSYFTHFPGPILKLGYHYLYNKIVKKHLKVSARLTHPTAIIESMVCLSLIFIILLKTIY